MWEHFLYVLRLFASAPMSSLTFRVLLYLWCGSYTSSSALTYVLPCLQEVDGITVLWDIRGAAGLFPCEGMTVQVPLPQRKIDQSAIHIVEA